MKCSVLLLTFLVGLAPLAVFADEIGDPAPPLTVKEWIKGGPVEIKPGTNIYVVVFWGTTNATCRAAIPRLNEIQKKFKDRGVVVVGVSDEPARVIRNFVEQPDVKIEFAVGADTVRRTGMAYMLGFKAPTIPQAFVVGKDGKVLWHGEPLRRLALALRDITTGKFDLEQAKRADAFNFQLNDYWALAHRGDPRARTAGETLIAGWTNHPNYLCDFAYYIITDTRNPRRDLTLAGDALDLAERLARTNTLRLFTTRAAFLFESGNQEQAIAMIKAGMEAAKTPKEKAALKPYLRALEVRWHAQIAAKDKPTAATVSTNGTSTATNKPTITGAKTTSTNQSRPIAPASSEKAGKAAP